MAFNVYYVGTKNKTTEIKIIILMTYTKIYNFVLYAVIKVKRKKKIIKYSKEIYWLHLVINCYVFNVFSIVYIVYSLIMLISYFINSVFLIYFKSTSKKVIYFAVF